MAAEAKDKLEKCVRRILKHGDMNLMTESKVRKLAAEETGYDLHNPANRSVVKRVVEDYFFTLQQAGESGVAKGGAPEARRPARPPLAARPPAAKPPPPKRRRNLIIHADEDEDAEDDSDPAMPESRKASEPSPLPQRRSSGRGGHDEEESDDAVDEEEEEGELTEKAEIRSKASNSIPVERNELRPQEGEDSEEDDEDVARAPRRRKRRAGDTDDEGDASEEYDPRRGKAKHDPGRKTVPTAGGSDDSGDVSGEEEVPDVRFKSKKQSAPADRQRTTARPEMDAYEDEDEAQSKVRRASTEVNDNGDVVICKLSKTRTVTIQEFKGKLLVSIREYYSKDGKMRPTSKGISLTEEQWGAFKRGIPRIEAALKRFRR